MPYTLKLLFAVMLGLYAGQVNAQLLMNKDSLLRLLPLAKEDTSAVLLYIDIGEQYEVNEPDVAKTYYRKARDLSRKINFDRGVIKYVAYYTYVLNMQGFYDSSLQLNLQAVAIAREIKDSINLGKAFFNTGTSYRFLGEYENAVKYYEEGKKIFEKFGNEDIEAQCNDVLQLLYFDLRNYAKAIELGERSVSAFRKTNDKRSLGFALNNLGMSYSKIKNNPKSAALFFEALEIGKETGDQKIQVSQYLNLSDVFLQQGEYERMKPHLESALMLAKELELNENELIALKGLSVYYKFKNNYKRAEQYGREALAISYRFNFKNERAKVFTLLSSLAYAAQNMPVGHHYAVESELLSDSLLNETIQRNTIEIEKKFESDKKESTIKQLEASKKLQQISIRQKITFNYILIGGAATLLIIFLLSYRNYKQKQKLHQQRIIDLETEKKLTATEAILKGEEQERSRMAKDLHDGLGGMLSSVKLTLGAMKGNTILSEESTRLFSKALDQLDHSINEMRRVAHNMMPEALVKFGLQQAIQDYCNALREGAKLTFKTQFHGLENRLDAGTEIIVYRIIQELLNNAVKHAEATELLVQVMVHDGNLNITVEDDGKGFVQEVVNSNGGAGLANVRARVDYLKGHLDIQSNAGNGTSIHIDFNISDQ